MSAPPPQPPPPAWAFETAYGQALPPQHQYNPETGFSTMANWASGLGAQYPNTPAGRIVPGVATYDSGKKKADWVGITGLSAVQKAEYKAGMTKSAAAKHFVNSGSIGLVTSSLSNAAQNAVGENEWHTVAMARHQGTVFVHDPAYNAASYGGAPRMADVGGTRMVQALVGEWPKVEGAYYQGPPSGYNRNQQECMGRSAQWMEGTVAGTLPWPPNVQPQGGQWTWHSKH